MTDHLKNLVPEVLIDICIDFCESHHRAFIVGGWVRDSILNRQSKDIDIEVFNATYEDLIKVLNKYGRIDTVGASFGVVKLKCGDYDFDFSLPRKDSLVGESTGRGRGFIVETCPSISYKEAAARRDFTINSLMFDPIMLELLDFFGGVHDIEHKILRATSDAFSEDPLRVLRGMQFCARFNLTVEKHTAEMCRSLVDKPLVRERECEEWMKLFIKSEKLSYGISYLKNIGWLDRYPHIKSIDNLKQDPAWHPEGDVLTHSVITADLAIMTLKQIDCSDDDKAAIVAAALCHDFGKAATTCITDGRVTSYGHNVIGATIAEDFLNSIGIKKYIIDRVKPMVSEHMFIAMNPKPTKRDVRKLAHRLSPAIIADLCILINCDHNSRYYPHGASKSAAVELAVLGLDEHLLFNAPKPMIKGQDIIDVFNGVPRDKLLGEAIKTSFEAYLDGKADTKEECLNVAMKYIRKSVQYVTGKDLIELGMSPGVNMGVLIEKMWDLQKNGYFMNKDHALTCALLTFRRIF